MKPFLTIIFVLFSFSLQSEEKENNYSKIDISKLQQQYPHVDVKKLLYELESFDNYRPPSYNDATRNPFQIKRYKFNLEK